MTADAPRRTPAFIRPMECTPTREVPDDRSKWIYEVKLDGYRSIAVVNDRRGQLFSRYGNAWPERFPAIHAALGALKRRMVLDGEIVAVDGKGRPSFQELQNWQSTRLPIVYYAFDLLNLDGRDLRRLPLEERKKLLAEVAASFREPLLMAATLDAKLPTVVRQLKKLALEGIVAKRLGSAYQSGTRSSAWLKHRFNESGEFVIGGYIPGEGPFARLLVGEWEGDDLLFVKKLKNGFTAASKREVYAAIKDLRITNCPFANLPEPHGRSTIDAEVMKTLVWVRPVRKVEIDFVERTAGGKLRHAAFRKLGP